MSVLPFWRVDAFVDGPDSGNPAAVIALDAWRADEELQRIASGIGLPATAFAVPATDEGDYAIRWFSPHGEIGLCGHGTLAAGHALIGDRDAIRFATRTAGVVSVTRDKDLYWLTLPALAAVPRALPESVAAIGGSPLETLWHPRGYVILRYADEAAVRALSPDPAALAALGDIQHSATASGTESDIVSRVFNRRGEDSVTGSAHALLTPYWAERLGRPSFGAVQASPRGGRLSCRLDGDRVSLGGKCVTVREESITI